MKFLRTLHLYLGCLFAPMLIFFAVSGSWQLFNWHESKKDHTYTAPRVLTVLSDVHKETRTSRPHPDEALPRSVILCSRVPLAW